jgi:hypothetical protein
MVDGKISLFLGGNIDLSIVDLIEAALIGKPRSAYGDEKAS